MKRLVIVAASSVASVAVALTGSRPAQAADQPAGEVGPGVPKFEVRPGYRVTLAADGLGLARALEFDDKGTLYVSDNKGGTITSLRDTDGDGVYETRAEFVGEYPTVHGMHWRDGWLWFTQSGAVHKGRDTDGDGAADDVETILPEGRLPRGGGHWWRSILVAADGKTFYTSIGDSGNINDEGDTDRQKIWRFNADGSGKTLFASGLRNTEKLRFRPGTAEVWGVDHGSDNYGMKFGERPGKQPVTDGNPPCEFNHYEDGKFYGHPFVTGNKLARLEFMDKPDILDWVNKTTPPAWPFGAHWAPNGFTFLSGDKLGPDHNGDAFVAFHGSWNSTNKVGYRIERVTFDEVTGRPYGAVRIVSTLAADGKGVLGRPVDCVEAADGSVLFSDDQTQRVYRITAIAPAVSEGR